LTTAQRNGIASPSNGLTIYNTDCNVFQYWNGSQWITIPNNLMLAYSNALILGNTSINPNCLPTNFTYTLQGMPASVSYTWAVASGASIVSGQGTPTVNINFSNTFSGGTLCVTPDTCLFSSPKCISIQTPTNSVVFNYVSNAYQTWTVPNGVYCIRIKAWGAGGGGGGSDACSGGGVGGNGGGGAYSSATVNVNPGDVLWIYVGEGGGNGIYGTNAPGGAGGWGYGSGGSGGNSGGTDFSGSGGGGGGSSAVINNTAGTLLVVAGAGGGGGGAGYTGTCAGGAGGASCSNGGNGNATGGSCAGNSTSNGTNGQPRIGDGGGGGGGGGGYTNGGTGGTAPNCDCGAGGGGGGNSYSISGAGNIINGSGQTPGNNTDYILTTVCPSCAKGGNGSASGTNNATAGGNGIVVIYY
jgi:hypothetical protein